MYITYREFSCIDAVEVKVPLGANVDGAAELSDKQPLVEFGVEERVDLHNIWSHL